MTHIADLASLEQRIEDILSVKKEQAEIRRLAEIRRQKIGRIEFKSAGATRKR